MGRQTFTTRSTLLKSESQRNSFMALVANLPLDDLNPLELVAREKIKVRGLDANARMWAGPLKDISEQAWVQGRQYSAEVWHEHFKAQYLPEAFDPELCKEGYVKWDYTPAGDRVLVGSSTQLTRKGFAQYLTQIEADGAGLGVMFTASPSERRPA